MARKYSPRSNCSRPSSRVSSMASPAMRSRGVSAFVAFSAATVRRSTSAAASSPSGEKSFKRWSCPGDAVGRREYGVRGGPVIDVAVQELVEFRHLPQLSPMTNGLACQERTSAGLSAGSLRP